jgi:hypothetical protein
MGCRSVYTQSYRDSSYAGQWAIRPVSHGQGPLSRHTALELDLNSHSVAGGHQDFEASWVFTRNESCYCYCARCCAAISGNKLSGGRGSLDAPHHLRQAVQRSVVLQARALCAQITSAWRKGRVDCVIQSTDKNFMVPVGGAILAARMGHTELVRGGSNRGLHKEGLSTSCLMPAADAVLWCAAPHPCLPWPSLLQQKYYRGAR